MTNKLLVCKTVAIRSSFDRDMVALRLSRNQNKIVQQKSSTSCSLPLVFSLRCFINPQREMTIPKLSEHKLQARKAEETVIVIRQTFKHGTFCGLK